MSRHCVHGIVNNCSLYGYDRAAGSRGEMEDEKSTGKKVVEAARSLGMFRLIDVFIAKHR